jgi:hypothetical protein
MLTRRKNTETDGSPVKAVSPGKKNNDIAGQLFVEVDAAEENDDKIEEEGTEEKDLTEGEEGEEEEQVIVCINADGKLIRVEQVNIPAKIASLLGEGNTKSLQVVTFSSRAEYEEASKGEEMSKTGATVTETSIEEGKATVVTPTKAIEETNRETGVGNDLPMLGGRSKTAFNPYSNGKKRVAVGSDEEDKAETGIFAKKMKDTIKSAGAQAVIHVVESEPEFWNVRVALVDFINPKRQFTHWLHRPTKWEDVLQMFAGDKEGMKRINMFLSYISSVRFRDPAGNDIPESISTRGRNGVLTLYRDVFLVVLPKKLANLEIAGYILESFGPIFNDTEIQSCYHMQYMAGSENTAADQMLSPIRSNAPGQNGKYWSMLEGALTDNSEVIVHESLNKILTSAGIVTALGIAGSTIVTETAVKSKSIPDGLKTFVYGRITA